MDVYRISLFKKKIRQAVPWYKGQLSMSKGKCSIVMWHIWYPLPIRVVHDLKNAGICFKVYDQDEWWNMKPGTHEPSKDFVYALTIPIDQEALPERKRKHES